jgi:hypothetical protein
MVADAVMLGDPDGVEAERLRPLDLRERLPEEVAALRGADPEPEVGHAA